MAPMCGPSAVYSNAELVNFTAFVTALSADVFTICRHV